MSTGSPVVAALAGVLMASGFVLVAAAVVGVDLLPSRGGGRPWVGRLALRATVVEAGAVVVAALVAWLLTGWPVAALGGAAAVIALPRVLGRRRAQQRIGRLEALEAWIRQLADALTGGAGIEEALLASVDDAPRPIADEVATLGRRLEFRVSTEEALRAFADDVNHPVGDTIAAALIIAARVRGRGLHQVLTALADTVAKDVAAQREIDAERATHRTTAVWVVVALGLYTAFAVANRDYVAPFGTVTGQVALAGVALLYAATIWWLHRLASPARTHRFLPPERRRP